VYTHYPVIFKVAKFRGQSGASGLIALTIGQTRSNGNQLKQ
jgi:hypothetical protein